VPLPELRDSVALAMAAIVQGEPEGFVALFRLATPPVRKLIAFELGAVGFRLSPDQLDDLTRSAVVDIAGLAGTWRPDGGALPWNWARQRILAQAFTAVTGCHNSLNSDPDGDLPEAETQFASASDEADLAEALDRLAGCVPEAELLLSGLNQVANERDRCIWLEYVAEQATGNPSPAGAVARIHGLAEPNVRKIVQRVRKGLRDLGQGDPSFEMLGQFPAVAA
jgi:hypothetical protein